MQFLETGHDFALVAMSLLVALVAGFTGLSLTKDLSQKSISQKKLSIALASVALGGGIWSMHFVAMLGLQLPILFYYDAAITLASALIAILIVAAALVLLHFTKRTPRTILTAGAVVGVGILVMHYVGMSGLQLCRAVYSFMGVILSSSAAIGLCVLAFWIAYQERTNRSILFGTLCFGIAVFAVHFLAMAGTNFVQVAEVAEFGPTISNEGLAVGVILSSFLIFGASLWVGTAYLTPAPQPAAEPASVPVASPGLQIPCERDGGKVFIAPRDVAFVRADGHYTQVYTDTDRLFCAWPITEATRRLVTQGFLKVHRSYLINPEKVARFNRSKDKGSCTFTSTTVPQAPVSRANLKDVEAILAAPDGAIRAT
ncbi:MAG: MHYT domain-containing protein [Pseudomonadota bacterium]